MIKREPNLPRFGREQPFPETSLGDYLPTGAPAPSSFESRLPPTAAVAGFLAALDRLEETIETETTALEAHQAANMADFNSRKSRSLLELTRLARALPPGAQPTLRTRLDRLRAKLLRNQAVLKLNVEAVREIADLLLGALGEAESDGTYDMPLARRDAAR
jgi:hypothetical protein